jgi:hypothetical protein
MPEQNDLERALMDGARRSRMACSPYSPPPLAFRIWRRYRWPLIGAGVIALVEFLGSLIGSNLRHF